MLNKTNPEKNLFERIVLIHLNAGQTSSDASSQHPYQQEQAAVSDFTRQDPPLLNFQKLMSA